MQEMTMVERVARGIARRRAIRLLEAAGSDESHLKDFTVIGADMDDALIAIEAMRTPTDAMIAEGNAHDECAPYDIYESMIDAALSE